MIKLTTLLKEISITYTPEKIDEFVKRAERDLSNIAGLFNIALQKTLELNVQNVTQAPEAIQNLTAKLKVAYDEVEEKNNTYYNVVESYELGEYPNNVKRLEALFNQIDNKNLNVYNLMDALDHLLEAGKELSEFI